MRVFDLHCDTVYECEKNGLSLYENSLQWDVKRSRQYLQFVQVLAAWLPDTLHGQAAFEHCVALLKYARRSVPHLTLASRAQELFSTSDCIGILAMEGGGALAGRLENVAELASLGVRVLTLTWNGSNELGHGSLSHCDDGLTPFGKQVVTECENCGITVDVSHLNEAGFWDVAQTANRPFIASHSVMDRVHSHPRNLTDEQFREICRRGGLVGLNFCAAHLGEQSPDGFYRHLEHCLALGGESTVALGGDLDGTDLPASFGGIAFYETLGEYLAQKGYGETLIDRIFFQNAFNFFSAALQSAGNKVK